MSEIESEMMRILNAAVTKDIDLLMALKTNPNKIYKNLPYYFKDQKREYEYEDSRGNRVKESRVDEDIVWNGYQYSVREFCDMENGGNQ